MPRLGDYGVRELTPKRLARFREELEKAGVGAATVRKAMAIVQSILSFAVAEELVEFNAAASVRKPRYERAREPHIFLPAEVEGIRGKLASLRDRTLVSRARLLGPTARGGRLPARVGGHRRARDPLPRHQAPPHQVHAAARAAGRGPPRVVPRVRPPRRPAAGVPGPRRRLLERRRLAQLAVADLAWRGAPGEPAQRADLPRCAPAGTRPRDLRSSFITVQVYAGVPLTTIAKQCGTSVTMIEKHYAGVIENWDGKQIPAERQIKAAREGLRQQRTG